MIELPVVTGDRDLIFCGPSLSSTFATVVVVFLVPFLFRFPDPRPVVGMVFEGRISAIYTR